MELARIRRGIFILLAGLILPALVAAAPVKFTVPANVPHDHMEQAELLADYGNYRLYRAPRTLAETLVDATDSDRAQILEAADRLFIDAGAFDTQRGGLVAPPGDTPTMPSGPALQLIQFVGPVKQAWLDWVTDAGATPIHYITSNGYLVWADASARAALDSMAAQRDVLQFSAAYQDYLKAGPVLAEKLDATGKTAAPSETLPITVQVIDHPGMSETMDFIADVSRSRISPWSPVMKFHTGRFEVARADIPAIIAQPDVYWVEEYMPRHLTDEIQNQIVAGHLTGDGSQPSGTGYLGYLTGLGFPTTPSSYPIVDVVDDGIGNGTVNSGDPTLHELGDDTNATRLSFVTNCTAASSGESIGGHGHINTSIVGGYDDRAGFPFQDLDGYQRGQGVNPWALMAGTRIFGPSFDLSNCGGTDTGLIAHTWNQGARISTNSWGCSGCAGTYDDSSQAFDAGTRDADSSNSVNEELFHLFAAGNSGSGSGTVGTPGNGKNMLTVGASENYRPDDEDGDWFNAICGTGPTDADDAMDVADFSSRGPSPGNRTKPETIAPGTHIQGTASTSPSYDGSSVCDQYRPSGQTDFAGSSGTSHSTPAVAGLSSLVWWWLENEPTISGRAAGSFTPTPALMKAYILDHPTYLTGVSANDDLPSNAQGYGMPNMDLLFNDMPKHVVNQDVLFDNSGESWQWIGSAADPAEPVRIMLVWTDQPGATGTSPQVNNLNLSMTTSGNTYLGNNFSGQWSTTGGTADTANNYEGIFLQPGTATDINITVDAFNIAGDGVPNTGDGTDQDFALVCYNCVEEPTFTLSSDPGDVTLCTPDDAVYNLDIGSILGFSDPVTLSASGNPAGTGTSFTTNPVNPPGNSTLTVDNTGSASFGSYTVNVEGTAGVENKSIDLGLDIYTAVPTAPTPAMPSDSATDVDLVPTLSWSASAQGVDYTLEIASDAGFTNIVYSTTVSGTMATVDPASELDPVSTYYWRVRSTNICGTGGDSTTFSFTTRPIPPVLLIDDDDNSPDVRAAFTDTLDALGINYDIHDTGNSDNEPDAAGLAPYRAVIWFSGDEFGGAAGPSNASEGALGAFLDNGGCLLMSSQDYHYDRDLTPFMTDYLGVSAVDDDSADTADVTGAGTVFGSLGTYTLDYGATGVSDFADTFTEGNGGTVAFTGDGGITVGTLGAAGNAVWMAYPFPALPAGAPREAMLQAFMDNVCPLGEEILIDGFESE